MSLRDKFIIEKSDEKTEPYYELEVEMDSNDADYIRETVSFNKSKWEKLPEFFFLMLSYLSQDILVSSLTVKIGVITTGIIGKTISMVFVKKLIYLLTIGIVSVIPNGVVAIPSVT